MHFAVLAHHFSLRIEDHRGIVVDASGAFLEKRSDNYDCMFARDFSERVGRRPRNRLGPRKIVVILALTEILRTEQLRQTNNLRALSGRTFDQIDRARQIRVRFRAAAHLNKRDFRFRIIPHFLTEDGPGRHGRRRFQLLETSKLAARLFGRTGGMAVFPIQSGFTSYLIHLSAKHFKLWQDVAYFTESAGTIWMLSIVIRPIGLLLSP